MDPQNCTHTLLLSTSPCTLSHDTRTAPYVGYPKLHDAYDYTHSPVSTALLHTLTQPFSEMLMEVFFTHFGHPIRACVWRYSHPVQILLLHLSCRSHCSNSLPNITSLETVTSSWLLRAPCTGAGLNSFSLEMVSSFSVPIKWFDSFKPA